MEFALGKLKLEDKVVSEVEEQLRADPGIQEKVGTGQSVPPLHWTAQQIQRMFKLFRGIKSESGAWSSFVGFREVGLYS